VSVNVDPLGSGTGEVEPIGDGWYSLCARRSAGPALFGRM
jgi:hypothetical protein